MGVLPPVAQQRFGLEQNVHALAQKLADTLRVPRGRQRARRRIQGHVQPFTDPLPGAFDQSPGATDLGQRVEVQLFEAAMQQAVGFKQQVDFFDVQLKVVGLVLTHQVIQRRCQLGHSQHARHVRAAFEGVHGQLQIVSGVQRHVLAGQVQKVVKAVEVGLRFLTEDIQQLRIKTAALLLDLQRLRAPLGQAVGAGRELVDIVMLTLATVGEFLDQLRQEHQRLFQQLINRWGRRDFAFDHPVQQVLNGPGQLRQHQRTHHATAALERMKGSPQFGQRGAVGRVGNPLRQGVVQGNQDFVGLFQKDFQQFFVHRFFVYRRRQQALRDVLRRRVQRQRAGQYLRQALHHLRVIRGLHR